jgi:diadenylate cyclase
MIAPGTLLRDAIDNIVKSRHGALLVFADEERISPMISGGIDINISLAPMILYELCKMDGAVLLNVDGTRINHANVQLMPDARISSQETGTRHRTAERVAKQIDALCISISAARDVVTVYVGDTRHYMDPIRTGPTRPCRPWSASARAGTRRPSRCRCSSSRTPSPCTTFCGCFSGPR